MGGFDIIGHVIIFNVPTTKNKAKELIKKYKNIKAVYVKSKIAGRLRTPRLKWLAGIKKTETIHKENTCIFKLDIKTCYFSQRLSHDRLEIAKKIKKGETVLVMFSGIAPYGIVIAKKSKAKKVYCVEISRAASKYAKENVKLNRLNKLNNIEIIQGDVKRIIPKFLRQKIKFDRIIMARPQLKESFLKEAFMVSKKGTIIHFYDFLKKQNLKQISEKIKKEAKKAKKKIKISRTKKVREIAPYKYHIRVDFKII